MPKIDPEIESSVKIGEGILFDICTLSNKWQDYTDRMRSKDKKRVLKALKNRLFGPISQNYAPVEDGIMIDDTNNNTAIHIMLMKYADRDLRIPLTRAFLEIIK